MKPCLDSWNHETSPGGRFVGFKMVNSDEQVSLETSDNVFYQFIFHNLTINGYGNKKWHFDKIHMDKFDEFRQCDNRDLKLIQTKLKQWYSVKKKRTMGQPMKYGESYLENVDSFEYLGFKLKYDTAVSHLMAVRASKSNSHDHAGHQHKRPKYITAFIPKFVR